MPLPETFDRKSCVKHSVNDERGDEKLTERKVDAAKKRNDESDCEIMIINDKDIDNVGSEQKTLMATKSDASIETGPCDESELFETEEGPSLVQNEINGDIQAQSQNASLSSQPVSDCSDESNDAPLQMSGTVFHLVLLPSIDICQSESQCPDSTEQQTSTEAQSAETVEIEPSAESTFVRNEKSASRAQEESQGVEKLCQNASLLSQPVSDCSGTLNKGTLQISSNVIQFIPLPCVNVHPAESHCPETVTKATKDSSAGAALEICKSSPSVAQSILEPPIRVAQLASYASPGVTEFPCGSSDNISHSSTPAVRSVANLSGTTQRSLRSSSRKEPHSVQSLSKQVPHLIPTSSTEILQLLPDSTRELKQQECSSSETIAQSIRIDQKRKSSVSNSSPKLKSSLADKLGKPDSVEVLPSSRALTKLLQNPSISIVEKTREVEKTKPGRRHNLRDNSSSKTERNNFAKQSDETKYVTNRRKQTLHKLTADGAIEGGETESEIYHVPWNKEKLQKNKSSTASDKTSIPISQGSTVTPFCIVGDTTLVVKKAVTETTLDRLKSIHVKKLQNKPGSSSGRQAETLDITDERIMDGCFGDETPSRESGVRKSTNLSSRRKNVEITERQSQKQLNLPALRPIQARPVNPPPDSDRVIRNKWRAECAICKERFVDNCELHRHVTLSHPGVRIVFCELCSASFRTDNELEQHRLSNHKKPEMKNDESNSTTNQSKTTTNMKILPHRLKKSTSNLNDCRQINRDNSANKKANFDVAYHSYVNQNFRARMAKKKVAYSTVRTRNFNKLSQSGASLSSITRANSRAKNTTQKSVYHYVDVDVMKHRATQNQFINAEIKKLVVELTRLEEPVRRSSKRRSSLTSLVSTKIGNDSRSSSSNETGTKRSSASDNGRTRRTRGSRRNIAEEKNVEITNESKVVMQEPLDDSVVATPRRSKRFREIRKGIYNEFEESSGDDSTKTPSLNSDDKSMRNEVSIDRPKSREAEKINFDKEIPSSEQSTTIEPGKTKKVSELLKKVRIVRKCVSTSSVTSSLTIDSNASGPSLEKTSSKEDREFSTILRSRKEKLVADEMRSKTSPYSLRKSSADKNAPKISTNEEETSDKKESSDAKDKWKNRKAVDNDERSKKNIDEENNQPEEEKSENGKQRNESFDVNDEKQQSNDIETNPNKDRDSALIQKNKFDHEEENKREKSDNGVGNRSKEKNLDDTDNRAEKTRLKDKNNDNSESSKNVINAVTRSQQENNGKFEKLRETDDSRPKEVTNEQCDTTLRKTHTSVGVPIKIVKQKCQRAIKGVTKPDYLCLVCEELFVLMQEVSREVDEKKTSGEPIKCPFCKRYFISIFHLELHVATNHLRCQKKVPCKKSRSSNDDKVSRNNELDCKSKIEVAIECPKCAMKFDLKKDLNEHMVIHDESPLPKETSSYESPKHLEKVVVPSKNEEIPKSQVNSNQTLDNSSSNDRTSVTPQSSTLDCSRCGAKFSKSTEYVRHVREAHSTSKSSSLPKRKNVSKKSASNDCLLYKEDSSHEISSTNIDKKICEPPKPKTTARSTADREDLFKQHLLNVTNNDKDQIVIVKRKRGRPRKIKEPDTQDSTMENIFEEPECNKVVEFLANYHTCKICRRMFRRAQDLLIHNMDHNENDASKGSSENVEQQDEKSNCDQESVINSIFDGVNVTQHSASTEEVEFPPIGRDVADDIDSSDDYSSDEVEPDSKKRGASPLSPEVSKIEEKTVDLKKRRIITAEGSQAESYDLPEDQFGDVVKDTMEESIETGIGVDDGKNKKLPIACNKCNRHFPNQSLLNEHLFFLHDDSLKDTVLTDVLTPIGESKRSNQSDTPQNWHCETCLQNFKLFQGYSRHRYFAHGDDSMVHVCENCSKVLTNVTMVNVHICTDMASYNCQTCKMTFPTGMSLRLHNTEKHMETNGQHLCERCDRNFLTNAMLQRHENSKHCFTRPYRARKSSPVRMATADTTNNEESEKLLSPKAANDDNDKSEERDSGCDQNADEEMDSMVSADTPKSRRSLRRSCGNTNIAKDKTSRKRKRITANAAPVKRKRGRPRKYRSSEEEEETSYDTSDDEDEEEIEDSSVREETVLHIDETEIHQCSFCQLYCLSITTLRNHMAQIHSVTDQICQICYKFYPAGKLIRHLMERHITSDDGYVPRSKTSWKFGTNSNELDTEILIKMLGMPRLVSLCEYRRHAGKTDLTCYPCFHCDKKSTTNELYGYHLLLHHDTMCALCNIEFKRGEDAARHKGEVHGSVGGYIWFADRTVMALTATKNFTDVTDSIFMQTLASDVKVDNSAAEENQDDSPEEDTKNIDLVNESTSDKLEEIIATITNGGEIVGTIMRDVEGRRVEDNHFSTKIETTDNAEERKNAEETILAGNIVDRANNEEATTVTESPKGPNEEISKVTVKPNENADSSIAQIPSVSSEDGIVKDEDCTEPEDAKFMIVVTDEDLQSFNIGNQYPNIWGLAAKISSTCDEITPSQVKDILERYFERQEDLGT